MDSFDSSEFPALNFDTEFESVLTPASVPVNGNGASSSSTFHLPAGSSTFGISPLCTGCQKYKLEMERMDQEHRTNFQFLKKKIIGTDLVIRRFKSKQDESEAQVGMVESLKKKLVQANRDSTLLSEQLRSTVESIKPLEEDKTRLEGVVRRKDVEIQNLHTRLKAEEAFKTQKTAWDERNFNMAQTVAGLEKKNYSLNTRNRVLESKMSDLEHENKSLNMRCSFSNRKLEEMSTVLKNAEVEVKKLWALCKSNGLVQGKRPAVVPQRLKSLMRKFSSGQGKRQAEEESRAEDKDSDEDTSALLEDMVSDHEDDSCLESIADDLDSVASGDEGSPRGEMNETLKNSVDSSAGKSILSTHCVPGNSVSNSGPTSGGNSVSNCGHTLVSLKGRDRKKKEVIGNKSNRDGQRGKLIGVGRKESGSEDEAAKTADKNCVNTNLKGKVGQGSSKVHILPFSIKPHSSVMGAKSVGKRAPLIKSCVKELGESAAQTLPAKDSLQQQRSDKENEAGDRDDDDEESDWEDELGAADCFNNDVGMEKEEEEETAHGAIQPRGKSPGVGDDGEEEDEDMEEEERSPSVSLEAVFSFAHIENILSPLAPTPSPSPRPRSVSPVSRRRSPSPCSTSRTNRPDTEAGNTRRDNETPPPPRHSADVHGTGVKVKSTSADVSKSSPHARSEAEAELAAVLSETKADEGCGNVVDAEVEGILAGGSVVRGGEMTTKMMTSVEPKASLIQRREIEAEGEEGTVEGKEQGAMLFSGSDSQDVERPSVFSMSSAAAGAVRNNETLTSSAAASASETCATLTPSDSSQGQGRVVCPSSSSSALVVGGRDASLRRETTTTTSISSTTPITTTSTVTSSVCAEVDGTVTTTTAAASGAATSIGASVEGNSTMSAPPNDAVNNSGNESASSDLVRLDAVDDESALDDFLFCSSSSNDGPREKTASGVKDGEKRTSGAKDREETASGAKDGEMEYGSEMEGASCAVDHRHTGGGEGHPSVAAGEPVAVESGSGKRNPSTDLTEVMGDISDLSSVDEDDDDDYSNSDNDDGRVASADYSGKKKKLLVNKSATSSGLKEVCGGKSVISGVKTKGRVGARVKKTPVKTSVPKGPGSTNTLTKSAEVIEELSDLSSDSDDDDNKGVVGSVKDVKNSGAKRTVAVSLSSGDKEEVIRKHVTPAVSSEGKNRNLSSVIERSASSSTPPVPSCDTSSSSSSRVGRGKSPAVSVINDPKEDVPSLCVKRGSKADSSGKKDCGSGGGGRKGTGSVKTVTTKGKLMLKEQGLCLSSDSDDESGNESGSAMMGSGGKIEDSACGVSENGHADAAVSPAAPRDTSSKVVSTPADVETGAPTCVVQSVGRRRSSRLSESSVTSTTTQLGEPEAQISSKRKGGSDEAGRTERGEHVLSLVASPGLKTAGSSVQLCGIGRAVAGRKDISQEKQSSEQPARPTINTHPPTDKTHPSTTDDKNLNAESHFTSTHRENEVSSGHLKNTESPSEGKSQSVSESSNAAACQKDANVRKTLPVKPLNSDAESPQGSQRKLQMAYAAQQLSKMIANAKNSISKRKKAKEKMTAKMDTSIGTARAAMMRRTRGNDRRMEAEEEEKAEDDPHGCTSGFKQAVDSDNDVDSSVAEVSQEEGDVLNDKKISLTKEHEKLQDVPKSGKGVKTQPLTDDKSLNADSHITNSHSENEATSEHLKKSGKDEDMVSAAELTRENSGAVVSGKVPRKKTRRRIVTASKAKKDLSVSGIGVVASSKAHSSQAKTTNAVVKPNDSDVNSSDLDTSSLSSDSEVGAADLSSPRRRRPLPGSKRKSEDDSKFLNSADALSCDSEEKTLPLMKEESNIISIKEDAVSSVASSLKTPKTSVLIDHGDVKRNDSSRLKQKRSKLQSFRNNGGCVGSGSSVDPSKIKSKEFVSTSSEGESSDELERQQRADDTSVDPSCSKSNGDPSCGKSNGDPSCGKSNGDPSHGKSNVDGPVSESASSPVSSSQVFGQTENTLSFTTIDRYESSEGPQPRQRIVRSFLSLGFSVDVGEKEAMQTESDSDNETCDVDQKDDSPPSLTQSGSSVKASENSAFSIVKSPMKRSTCEVNSSSNADAADISVKGNSIYSGMSINGLEHSQPTKSSGSKRNESCTVNTSDPSTHASPARKELLFRDVKRQNKASSVTEGLGNDSEAGGGGGTVKKGRHNESNRKTQPLTFINFVKSDSLLPQGASVSGEQTATDGSKVNEEGPGEVPTPVYETENSADKGLSQEEHGSGMVAASLKRKRSDDDDDKLSQSEGCLSNDDGPSVSSPPKHAKLSHDDFEVAALSQAFSFFDLPRIVSPLAPTPSPSADRMSRRQSPNPPKMPLLAAETTEPGDKISTTTTTGSTSSTSTSAGGRTGMKAAPGSLSQQMLEAKKVLARRKLAQTEKQSCPVVRNQRSATAAGKESGKSKQGQGWRGPPGPAVWLTRGIVVAEAVDKYLRTKTNNVFDQLLSACESTEGIIGRSFVSKEERAIGDLVLRCFQEEQPLDKSVLFSRVWTSIFSHDSLPQHARLALCRLFTLLCMDQGDLEQVRVLMYNMAWCGYLDVVRLTLSVVGVWPATLASSFLAGCSAIGDVLGLVLRDKARGSPELFQQTCCVMRRLCGWDLQQKVRSAESLLKSLLDKGKFWSSVEGKNVQRQGGLFELAKAVELLAVHQGSQWTEDQLMKKTMVSVAMRWERKAKDGGLEPQYIVFLWKIFRSVVAVQPLTSNSQGTILGQVFNKFISKKPGVLEVELECVEALLEMLPLCADKGLEILNRWLAGNRKRCPNQTFAKIMQAKSLLSLKKAK
ncbi:serine-rich adhesin for platelets [Aplysia californica]|uniref:Serine-rich adhesin for platelets n=1 Tax=Aplysia californica TaxID=6500 RepID=A0ABM0K7H3_APLCA|nr:serine-rich adhesin for platelets [Aplysia californica]